MSKDEYEDWTKKIKKTDYDHYLAWYKVNIEGNPKENSKERENHNYQICVQEPSNNQEVTKEQ
jgi:hypothetical protein